MKNYQKVLIAVVLVILLMTTVAIYFLVSKKGNIGEIVVYNNSKYTINLLPGYEPEITPSDGETGVVFKLNQEGNYPGMSINYYSVEYTSFEVLKESMTNWNYGKKNEEQVIIDGVTAFQVSGILNSKVVEGVSQPGKLHVANLVLEYRGLVFTISLRAESEEDMADLWEMLESFKFKDNEFVWKTFNDDRYDFQFQYPAFPSLTFSDSGQEFNPIYTHLLSSSSTVISITKEEVGSKSCHVGLCSSEAISLVVNDSLVWDNLGPQRYCDGGGCTPNGPIYRLIFKGSRYYVHFNQDFFNSDDQIEGVIKSWQFSR